MTPREKLLAGLVGVAGLLYAASEGFTRYQTALESSEDEQLQAESDLQSAKRALSMAKRAQRKLRTLQKRSLPANPDIARSLYQDWLRQVASDAGIKEASVVDRTNARSFGEDDEEQRELTFELTGDASIRQVARFLHDFYQTNHLQRISKANLRPIEGKSDVKLTFTVDALILPAVDREDRLAEEVQADLAMSLEDYSQLLDSRNLFAPFNPKSEVKETVAKTEEPGEDEEAKQTLFTGATYGNGWVMAVRQEKSGEVSYYKIGDRLEIGRIRGKITDLDGRRVIYRTREGQFELRLGEAFSEAVAVESSTESSAQARSRKQR
ncbi:MAG: hypothetical protein RH917_12415 [Lacipirellulaceae bacterium]